MFREACLNFLRGVVDSVRGCYKIFLLDRPPPTAGSSPAHQPQIPASPGGPALTTLALRRMEAKSQQREAADQRNADVKPKAIFRLFQCIVLNLICILLFHYLLIPLIEFFVGKLFSMFVDAETLHANNRFEYVSLFLTNLLNALWVVPIFVCTRVVNALWFQDIANAALRRRVTKQSTVQLSFSRSVADFCYAILLETVFLVQTFFVGLLPLNYVNTLLKLAHTSLLYALYSFEYVWMSQGVEMHQRLMRIQNNYPYFLGFGLPLTLITNAPSTVFLSGCLFGVFFPLFIVASYDAEPTIVVEWKPIKFFYPSVCVCDRLSLALFQKARAKMHNTRFVE